MKDGWIHICLSKIDFTCPHCGNKYSDDQDKYLNRIQNGKQGYTKITCNRCNERFGMCYDMTCNAVSFKLKNQL